MELEYRREPLPHLFLPQLLAPSLYADLVFPDIEPKTTGRIGRDIYYGEPEWDALMTQPAWAALASAFMSEALMKQVIAAFADDMRADRCLADPDLVYWSQRLETRAETQARRLSEDADPNALFFRFDVQAIDATYSKGIHCDWPRRIVGGVLFLTSAEDEGMEGGEFGLYRDRAFNNDRRPHRPELAAAYPFRHNQGVLFLNSNRGFHGPAPIRRMTGLRKWIYFSISSARDVWTPEPLR